MCGFHVLAGDDLRKRVSLAGVLYSCRRSIPVVNCLDKIEPVSYTHLDVYKRQIYIYSKK